ncbi:MAG TPA: FtsX-like permease family protein [Alphaproteobacteria bacterium]|nr:FtsX-like permease family protein [Alphaproteobacteria bacterium]
MHALDKKLLRGLWHMKGQVIAIAFIVGAGVAILVMSLSTLASLKESQAAYYERNRFADVFATLKRAPESLLSQIIVLPGVRQAETRIVRDVTIDVPGMAEPATGRVISLPKHGEALLNAVSVLEGREPRPDSTDEVLASQAFVEAHHFELGNGFSVLLNGIKRKVRIVGIGSSPEYVYARAPGAIMPDKLHYAILWMPRKALEAAFNLTGAFNDLSITLTRGVPAEGVIERLDKLLDRYGGVGAYARKDQVSYAYLQAELDEIKAIGMIIPPVFIVVSAFLLNVMLSRLVEIERDQIGLLKAFGYTKQEVLVHYLKFAFVIAALGVLIGYAMGWWLARLMIAMYTQFYKFPVLLYRADPHAFVLGALVALGTAALGATSSVRKAAELAPAVAMNPPAPADYAKGLLQHFDISKKFDGPTKMILRHIFRWPARSGSTLLGVAASTGLMISTLFSHDSVEKMIELFFYREGPYDAALHFTEPRGDIALLEVQRLPGILTAEPVREIAVRLRHGPREELTAVSGIEPTASLKSIIDEGERQFKLPENGLVISTVLASKLAARRGDRVTLEALEGRRLKRDLFVAAVVGEYIGSSAYMARAEVNRLMDEGPVISGAFLRVRLDELDRFYKAVKNLPAVATVTLQSVAIEMFWETIRTSQETIMLVYRIISAAIAAGVVYNSVRIALSERGRELATMRVLGFTRYEVSYILLGQSLLLVLAALPFGCIIGYFLSWLITQGINTDLFRIPLTITPFSYGFAGLLVLASSTAAGLVVRRELDRLDLVAVLKTRD